MTIPEVKLEECWAKSQPFQSVRTHALISGHVAQLIWDEYLSGSVRGILSSELNMDSSDTRAFVGYLVSVHDIGKISYDFQAKEHSIFEKMEQDPALKDRLFHKNERHEKTGRHCLKNIWLGFGEDRRSALLFPEIVSAHHQGKYGAGCFDETSPFFDLQKEMEEQMRQFFLRKKEKRLPSVKSERRGVVEGLLLGIMILSDWISSGASFCDGENWIDNDNASDRIRTIMLEFLSKSGLKKEKAQWQSSFSGVWPNIPGNGLRSLQKEVEKMLQQGECRYRLVLLEAPMGEGKTEAGVYAALRLAELWEKDGSYFALPTAATANQMVKRIQELFRMNGKDDRVRLLHSMAWLDESGQFHCNSPDEKDEISRWLVPLRKGLLGQYAVGTVDQAMFAATVVRYGALRLLGLSNKVLIIDEIHSYDAYMSRIITRLLEWCAAMDVPVVLLSATLPPVIKKKLLEPYTDQELSGAYPLITAVDENWRVEEKCVGTVYHRLESDLEELPILNSPDMIAETACEMVRDGGCICVLMNTVREAQAVYTSVRKLYDGDLLLFHAQYPLARRAEIEEACIKRYGKEKSNRPARSILIATQVVEQSLDVDFDAMLSAVAPIDLLFQRLGRVHRHEDTIRPERYKKACFFVMVPKEQNSFGLSGYVYPECFLRRSVSLLRDRKTIRIPEDISTLVAMAYDPTAVPYEESTEWYENQIRQQVEAGASEQYIIRPPGKTYNALDEILSYDDEAPMLQVATRLGEPTIRLALLNKEQYMAVEPYVHVRNDVAYADICEPGIARMVFRQSASIRISLLDGELSKESYITGNMLTSGVWILQMENDCCTLAGGKVIINDMDLGIMIKEGNK